MTKPTSELASYLLNKDQTGTSTTWGGKPGVWFHTRFWARSVPVQSVHVTHLPGTSIAYSAPGPSSQYPTSPHEIRHLTKTLLRRPDGNSKSWWNAMIIPPWMLATFTSFVNSFLHSWLPTCVHSVNSLLDWCWHLTGSCIKEWVKYNLFHTIKKK